MGSRGNANPAEENIKVAGKKNVGRNCKKGQIIPGTKPSGFNERDKK